MERSLISCVIDSSQTKGSALPSGVGDAASLPLIRAGVPEQSKGYH